LYNNKNIWEEEICVGHTLTEYRNRDNKIGDNIARKERKVFGKELKYSSGIRQKNGCV
jgi:hypothetical protein